MHEPLRASADAVYSTARSGLDVVTGLEKPPVDLPYWYENAKPGPRQACTTQTGSSPAFDNDDVMNRSLTSPVNLTPALAYDCVVKDGQGNVVGRIAWTPGSPGTLTIAGTIFFDGNIEFQNSVERGLRRPGDDLRVRDDHDAELDQALRRRPGATRTGMRPRTCSPSSPEARPTRSASRSRTAAIFQGADLRRQRLLRAEQRHGLGADHRPADLLSRTRRRTTTYRSGRSSPGCRRRPTEAISIVNEPGAGANRSLTGSGPVRSLQGLTPPTDVGQLLRGMRR